MISKWRWLLLQLSRQLWLRAGLFTLLGVATALIATGADVFFPVEPPFEIRADAVGQILNILATSMLTVTTFSLTIMVSAYSAATANVTPRATRLLMQDTTTQNVLATFLGSFLFSLVGVVALSTGAYGERGLVILFIASLTVIGLVVLTILRWIEHLSRLGRVEETTQMIEKATLKALQSRIKNPCLGARPLAPHGKDIPSEARAVHAKATGYVQHLDMMKLSRVAQDNEGEIFIVAQPGTFIHPAFPICWIDFTADDECTNSIIDAYSISNERSFDQDPRYGLTVLSEVASKALSPAVNDPGTAIDVIGRVVRILTYWIENTPPPEACKSHKPLHPRLNLPEVQLADMLNDAFTPIARDGASTIEVQIKLQMAFSALKVLARPEEREPIERHSAMALKHAEKGLAITEDFEKLQNVSGDERL